MNACKILGFPRRVIRTGERNVVGDLYRNCHVPARAGPEAQPRIGRAAAGDNQHDRPVARSEDAGERLLIGATGLGRVPRVGMHPYSRKLFGRSGQLDLLIEEVGYRLVFKLHGRHVTPLTDQAYVFQK